jgi:uncharacterized protein DUF4406
MTVSLYPPPTGEMYYISGPIAGDREKNIAHFIQAAADLRARGYKILSPIEVNAGALNPDEEKDWSWYMRRDIEAMMHDDVTGVILLPGWEFSRGAQVELAVAKALAFRIAFLGECLLRPVKLDVPQ